MDLIIYKKNIAPFWYLKLKFVLTLLIVLSQLNLIYVLYKNKENR
jgi:hypothetical protein